MPPVPMTERSGRMTKLRMVMARSTAALGRKLPKRPAYRPRAVLDLIEQRHRHRYRAGREQRADQLDGPTGSQQFHPDVTTAVLRAMDAIRAAGKLVGVNAFDPAVTQAYVDAGASFLLVGADVAMLARGPENLAARWAATEDTDGRASSYCLRPRRPSRRRIETPLVHRMETQSRIRSPRTAISHGQSGSASRSRDGPPTCALGQLPTPRFPRAAARESTS